MAEIFEIRVQGHLSKKFDTFFNGMTISRQPDGTTTIIGEIVDQSALHGLLLNIRNMNIGLISVNTITGEGG